jgi:predicted alpha/beta-fold hydrolase
MGNTADLRDAVAEVHERYPNAQITLMGVSAGCGIVIRYLSEEAENPAAISIAGAVLICPGWDLNVTWQHMHLAISLYFAMQIRTKVLWKHRAVLSHAPAFWKAMIFGNTMSNLYRNLYGVAGFEDYEAFAAASDPANNAHKVTGVPVIFFNNKDDYACPWKSVQPEKIRKQPNTALVSLSCGGSHLGGYTSWNTQRGGTVNWGAENAARFLKALVVRHKERTTPPSV